MFEELAAGYTLMDNDYMVRFFDGQPRCVEAVLRAILEMPELHVESTVAEHEIVSLLSRSARLDVMATDADGRRYDIEVQRDLNDATPRRARFYSSLMDSDALAKGAKFGELPECVTVFITEGDALKEGVPLSRIERICLGSGTPFGDGSSIIYANAAYTFGKDEGGELADVLHDFMCADPAAMRCPALAERAREIKLTEEGERQMSGVSEIIFNKGVEQGLEQGLEQGRDEAIAKLLAAGVLTQTQIAEVFGITVEDVELCAQRVAS